MRSSPARSRKKARFLLPFSLQPPAPFPPTSSRCRHDPARLPPRPLPLHLRPLSYCLLPSLSMADTGTWAPGGVRPGAATANAAHSGERATTVTGTLSTAAAPLRPALHTARAAPPAVMATMASATPIGVRTPASACESSRPLSEVLVINDNYLWTNSS
jgi:hypothetical protein